MAAGVNYKVRPLARKCGVSVSQLDRFFKRERGITPGAYLRALRIAQGNPALASGGMVKEAASAAGYTKANNFSRDFRELTGLHPSEYLEGSASLGGGLPGSQKKWRIRSDAQF